MSKDIQLSSFSVRANQAPVITMVEEMLKKLSNSLLTRLSRSPMLESDRNPQILMVEERRKVQEVLDLEMRRTLLFWMSQTLMNLSWIARMLGSLNSMLHGVVTARIWFHIGLLWQLNSRRTESRSEKSMPLSTHNLLKNSRSQDIQLWSSSQLDQRLRKSSSHIMEEEIPLPWPVSPERKSSRIAQSNSLNWLDKKSIMNIVRISTEPVSSLSYHTFLIPLLKREIIIFKWSRRLLLRTRENH